MWQKCYVYRIFVVHEQLETYDLMILAIIKLGSREYNGKKDDEGFDLISFALVREIPRQMQEIAPLKDGVVLFRLY